MHYRVVTSNFIDVNCITIARKCQEMVNLNLNGHKTLCNINGESIFLKKKENMKM